MQGLRLLLYAHLVSACCTFNQDRIPLADIKVLNFYKGRFTRSKTAPKPQLQCKRGCLLFSPESAQCYHVEDDEWICEASLPDRWQFGTFSVSCERYSGEPKDPYVLRGSCRFIYSLLPPNVTMIPDVSAQTSNGDMVDMITMFALAVLLVLGPPHLCKNRVATKTEEPSRASENNSESSSAIPVSERQPLQQPCPITYDLDLDVDVSPGKVVTTDTHTHTRIGAPLLLGTKVEVNVRGGGRYCVGVISWCCANGTYEVDFEDGDTECGVSSEMIKVVTPETETPPKP